MPKHPIHPIHIIFDGRVIDETLVIEAVKKTAGILSEDSETINYVRLSIMSIGHRQGLPLDSQTFIEGLTREPFLKADLQGAFSRIFSEYSALDKSGQGTGNPEVLLILGSEPDQDWVSAWKAIEPYRALILTYWINKQPLSDYETLKLQKLLGRISLPDPDTQSPRFKIVNLFDGNESAVLEDILLKMAARLKERVQRVGKISI